MRHLALLVFLLPSPVLAQSVCPDLDAELIDFTSTLDTDPGCFQIASMGKWSGCDAATIQVTHTCSEEVTFEDVRDWTCDGEPCVEIFQTGTIGERGLPLPDDGITVDTSYSFWVGEDPVEIAVSYGRTREQTASSDVGGGDGGCATGSPKQSLGWFLLLAFFFGIRRRTS